MKYVIILIIFCKSILPAQPELELEARVGVIIFDIREDLSVPLDNILHGQSIQTDFGIWQKLNVNKYVNARLGIGFSNYFYLEKSPAYDFETNFNKSTSYVHVKLGMSISPFPKWSWISLSAIYSNYILLHKKTPGPLQNYVFSNMDVGLNLRLNHGFNIIISVPITISPILSGTTAFRKNGVVREYYTWVKTSGLNMGVRYSMSE